MRKDAEGWQRHYTNPLLPPYMHTIPLTHTHRASDYPKNAQSSTQCPVNDWVGLRAVHSIKQEYRIQYSINSKQHLKMLIQLHKYTILILYYYQIAIGLQLILFFYCSLLPRAGARSSDISSNALQISPAALVYEIVIRTCSRNFYLYGWNETTHTNM